MLEQAGAEGGARLGSCELTLSKALEAIRDRRGKHTTLIIAHRLSTLKEADRIIVITEGVISQQGTHQSLRDAPGLYRRLWEIQAAVERDENDAPPTGSGGTP